MAAKVKALQEWCRRQCDGYRDVNVTNLTSSWKSGLAFCAIIHRYRPDLIDYDSLKKEDVFENNKLAFDVASEQLGIPALLDPEDMVIMTVPDKLCIVTYVAQYYNYFHNKPQAGGPGVRSGVKRQSVHDHVPVNNANEFSPPEAKRSVQQHAVHVREDEPMQTAYQENETAARRRGGTLEDRCQMCNNKVYLLERHISSTGRLYHRHCFRGYQRGSSISKKVPDEKENVTPPSNSSSLGKLSSGLLDSAQSSRTKDGLPSLTIKQTEKSSDETFKISSSKPSISSSSIPEAKSSLLLTKPSVTSVSGYAILGDSSLKPIVSQSAYSEANTALSTKPPAYNSAWETKGMFNTKATVSNRMIPEVKSSLLDSPAVGKSSNHETSSAVSTRPVASSILIEEKSILTTRPTVTSSNANPDVKSAFMASPYVNKSSNLGIRSAVINKPPANNSDLETRTTFYTKASVSSNENPEGKGTYSPSSAVSKTTYPDIRSAVSTKPTAYYSSVEPRSIFTTSTVSNAANPEVKNTLSVNPAVSKTSTPENKVTYSTANTTVIEPRNLITIKPTVSNTANPEVKNTFSVSPAVSKTSTPESKVTYSTANNTVIEPRNIITIKPTVSNTANPEVKNTFSVSPAVSKTSTPESKVTYSTADNTVIEPRKIITIKPTVSNTANPEVKNTFSVSPAVSKTSTPESKVTYSTANNTVIEPRRIFTTPTVGNTANTEVKNIFSVSPAVSKTSTPESRVTYSTANNTVIEPRSIITIKPTVSNTANPEMKNTFSGNPAVNKSSNPEIRTAFPSKPVDSTSRTEPHGYFSDRKTVTSTASANPAVASPAVNKSSNPEIKGAAMPVDRGTPMETKSAFSAKTTSYGSASVAKNTAYQPRTTSSSTNLLTALYSTPGYKTNTLSSDHGWSVNSTTNNDKETLPFRKVILKTVITSSTNVNDSARRPLFASSITTSSLTITTDATASKSTGFSSDSSEKKLCINNNYNAEITLGGLASSIGLISSVDKSQIVTSTPSSTRNVPNSNLPIITNVSSVTSTAFGLSSSKPSVNLSNMSVASSGTKSSSPKFSANVGFSSGETGFVKHYTPPLTLPSGATSSPMVTATSLAFATPRRISKTVENTSTTSSNFSTTHSTVNGRAESTSVTWSNPWSSRALPSSESLRTEASAPTTCESSSGNSSKNSRLSLLDEDKSNTGERRTCEKDQEIVAGLLQRLAEVRAEKLRGSTSLGRNSLTDGPPIIKSGRNMGTFETVVTPKATFGTPTGESGRGHSAVSTNSDLFDVGTRIVACTSSATKTRNVVVSTSSKTEWQLEAERRAAERRGGYVDPEKKMKQRPETFRQLPWQLAPAVANPAGNENAEPTPSRAKYGAPELPHESLIKESTHMNTPADRFVNKSDVSKPSLRQGTSSSVPFKVTNHVVSSVAPVTNDETRLVVRRQIVIPQLATPVQHKITDSSEPAVPVDVILSRLEELDKQLQVMESRGRELEEKIRGGSDDAMDEDKDSVMGMWFDLIKQRNELIREESYLMYKRRQQELEQLHEELEYQLRCLLEKPEEVKSPQDKRHEDQLLRELVETVALRSSIIDSMETDRIRYLEEDQKLEAMMASSGLSENKDCGKRRNSKVKKKKRTFAEKQGQPGEKAKSKKKLFKFISGKKSVPNPDRDIHEATDVQ